MSEGRRRMSGGRVYMYFTFLFALYINNSFSYNPPTSSLFSSSHCPIATAVGGRSLK